jgi:archaellum biogenesis ATPase FlaH
MKKILITLLLILLGINNTFAYIDYRHDIKTDYYSSEIYMNKYINIKEAIDEKIEKIYLKAKNKIFEDRVDYIENFKENILNYLYNNHIKKDNLNYYKLVYYYNKLDYIKYKTNIDRKIVDITKKYNHNYNYTYNNYSLLRDNCTFFYN